MVDHLKEAFLILIVLVLVVGFMGCEQVGKAYPQLGQRSISQKVVTTQPVTKATMPQAQTLVVPCFKSYNLTEGQSNVFYSINNQYNIQLVYAGNQIAKFLVNEENIMLSIGPRTPRDSHKTYKCQDIMTGETICLVNSRFNSDASFSLYPSKC